MFYGTEKNTAFHWFKIVQASDLADVFNVHQSQEID